MTISNAPVTDAPATPADRIIPAPGVDPTYPAADDGNATPPQIPTETGEDAAESAAHPS